MGLEGLRLPIFLGWISGVFFVSKPWGKISFISYFHPFTLYALIVNIIFTGLWIDFYDDATSFIANKPLTTQIFYLSTSTGVHVFNGYMRLIFFIFAGRIAKMLNLIKELMGPVKPRDLRCTWALFLKLFWIILIFHLVNAGIVAGYVCASSDSIQNKNSMYFSGQIRPKWYFVIFFILGSFPVACCIYFTFSFIFVCTFCVLCVFEQFCEVLMDIGIKIQNQSGEDSGFRQSMRNSTKDTYIIDIPAGDIELVLPNEPGCSGEVSTLISGTSRNFKVELLERLDRIKELFGVFDSVVGPMVLGMLIRNVVIVINEASSVFINPSGFVIAHRGCAFVNFFGDVVQFIILELGSWTQRRMNKWKTDLEKMIILMPTSFEKDHLSDVVHQVCKWKWQMSASGFFNINRQLMSGIVATMLSYIVILFQLHVSESPVVSAAECTRKNETYPANYFDYGAI
ncbi:unnamed protein product [Allacma fusca]|uniref:Gustatory receptor n=1 Tax=Allacma fusca TaxID=39272 RepID=A0A8J2KRA7_9HEXA|nr:unnamed protein product [Allacma fusca]